VIDDGDEPVVAARSTPTPVETTPAPKPVTPTPPTTPAGVVTIAAAGDIVTGTVSSTGRSPFADVEADLAGDVVLGNLEGTISSEGTSSASAGRLLDAGFTVMSLANDRSYDSGASGLRQTIAALDEVGLLHAGEPGQMALQRVGAIRVAIVGFSSYPWTASVTDLAAAKRLVRAAARRADVVVVSMHAGAEGAGSQNVRPGMERFRGENRGDVVRFGHAVVDAGADLVVGHGPRVLRGMEWYRGRLIAYSLGSLVTSGAGSLDGPLATSAVLRVILRGDGTFETGRLVPVRLTGSGAPVLDPSEAAHAVVRDLSRADFGARGVSVAPDGVLSPS
jgi:poly-gamma-glutamate capsule biosynthesis protein CapA/YwtB (metallophosphatase superfamily)